MNIKKSAFGYSALAIAAFALCAGGAQANTISFLNTTGGLYSTGENSNATALLSDNGTDSHYSVAAGTGASISAGYSSAHSGSFASAIAVTSSGSDNFGSTNSWVGYNTSGQQSTWLSLNSSGSATASTSSYYIYKTTFSLTGMDLNSIDISGQWASDNRGRGIYVNGYQVATIGAYGGSGSSNANAGSGALTSFSITSSMLSLAGGAFNSGINTIEFFLVNSVDNATGVRVEFNTANGSVPEPSTLVLLGLGVAGFSVMRRRKA